MDVDIYLAVPPPTLTYLRWPGAAINPQRRHGTPAQLPAADRCVLSAHTPACVQSPKPLCVYLRPVRVLLRLRWMEEQCVLRRPGNVELKAKRESWEVT